MQNPLEGLSPKQREMLFNMFRIMTNPTDNENDMRYVINNAQPMVDVLKQTVFNRMVQNGMDSEESEALLSVLIQMTTIAGGINFADFSVTEMISEELAE